MIDEREEVGAATAALREVLPLLDDRPGREGLEATPGRVVRAWVEMTAGRHEDPAAILATTFGLDEHAAAGLVQLDGIEFCSLCEHHLMPFFGTASVTYLPGKDGRVVGVSKLVRLVDCFARRLQIQERMTDQIARALVEHLGVAGVRVVVEATHGCMVARGVNRRPVMTTRVALGELA